MSIREVTFTRPTSHRDRFAAFGIIGAFVFWVGIGLQVLLTGDWRLGATASFVIQGVISVQLSYLLNRHWTWRSEQVPFWRGWRRFNGQKVVTILANLALYAVLLRAGINYLAANVATTVVFTVVNYAATHLWAFRPGRPAGPKSGPPAPSAQVPFSPERMANARTVSVVVPCRGNERTIRATVDSLLAQDYPALTEVILVGTAGDTTWRALRDVSDPRLMILEREETPYRDSNAKRDLGLQRARGEILALADSDIVLRPDWLSRGLSLLAASGADCVAGGMASIHDGFLGRFVDGTRMAAKTPRVPRTYVVTSENFGRHGRKPPVTANVIFTRELYRRCPVDARWGFGYEDYEWFWRMAAAGYRILFSSELCGRHHHRRSLRLLCWEYRRSGEGCARFVRRHPGCPLARKRLRQAVLLPAAAVALAGVEAAAAAVAGPLVPVLSAGLMAAAAAVWEFAHQRNPEAMLYPLLNGILGSVFLFSLARGLMAGVCRATPGPGLRPVGAAAAQGGPVLVGAVTAEESG
jgi:putative flippase GtrA/GT2 family glycosyltransferase